MHASLRIFDNIWPKDMQSEIRTCSKIRFMTLYKNKNKSYANKLCLKYGFGFFLNKVFLFHTMIAQWRISKKFKMAAMQISIIPFILPHAEVFTTLFQNSLF